MEDGEVKGLDTRERLVQAAGEMFSQFGFQATSIRAISQRAKANVAAVNYHFGHKEALYSAVLEHTLNWAAAKYPRDLGLDSDATAEETLQAFIKSFLLQLLDDGRPAWHGKLMAREIIAPSALLDQVIEAVLGPLHKRLAAIVAAVLGAHTNDQTVRFGTLSIIGQCVYYHNARMVISRLYHQKLGPEEAEVLSHHIAQFSLGGLRWLAQQGVSSGGLPRKAGQNAQGG
jgi:TetR/AcrR family transcriptional regulator, regulator of cefoperazone and chloramphenicol sensitivity